MTDRTFAGLPITGEINKSRSASKQQKSLEEFQTLVMDTLNAPGVEALRFEAYTPFFADGEPCEFGVYGQDTYVKVEGVEETAGDSEDGFLSTWNEEIKGGEETAYRRNPETNRYESIPTGRVFERHPSYDQFKKFEEIFSGAFDDVIYDLFGDHCQVEIRKTGITVDGYEHD